MKKKLVFEVEEGNTNCLSCAISSYCITKETLDNIPCDKYDLSTLKYIGEDEKDS